jgi:hypothetical protein
LTQNPILGENAEKEKGRFTNSLINIFPTKKMHDVLSTQKIMLP